MKILLLAIVFALSLSQAGFAQSAPAPDEQLISAFVSTREALAADSKVDINEMSKVIRGAISEAESLERRGDYRAALERLKALEQYRPLLELPSYDVQMLAAWLNSKLGDSSSAGAHQRRAEAMRELLSHRLGTGETPDDPKRVLMVNDMTEWVRMQLARVNDVKSYPYQGRELMEVTYTGPETGNKPKIAYFELDRRVRAARGQRNRLFDPIPIAEMRPEDRSKLELARQKRQKFLEDDSFPYLELIGKIGELTKSAYALDARGQSAEALAKLKEVEAIRPIEDIPMTELVALYSLLNGKTGNNQKQRELRALLFGINQAIAHSGDALTPERAIEVIAVEEEYTWLRDKALTRVKQRIQEGPRGKLDVLTARDAGGNERDYYFDIARMFQKSARSLRQPSANQ